MGLEDDFLLNDADDEKTIEFIRNYLPQELKEKFSEDELYYFLDLIDEYYSESGILDVQPDADGYVDIDLEQVVEFIVKEAKKDEVTCHFKNPGGIHQRFERRTQKAELRARHPFSAQYDSFGTDHQ